MAVSSPQLLLTVVLPPPAGRYSPDTQGFCECEGLLCEWACQDPSTFSVLRSALGSTAALKHQVLHNNRQRYLFTYFLYVSLCCFACFAVCCISSNVVIFDSIRGTSEITDCGIITTVGKESI